MQLFEDMNYFYTFNTMNLFKHFFNKSKIFLLSSLMITYVDCYSQKIENVDFTVKNNFLIIKYDLVNCPPREIYNINVKIITESSIITPLSVVGDLHKVPAGRNKKIEWDVLKDRTELIGNIEVVVEIVQTYSTKIIGGPSNVVFSMLMPGLGDIFVNDKRESQIIKWYYVTGAFVGSAYLAYSSKLVSNNYYEQYHNATNQSLMDETYKLANDYYHTYQYMLGVAASIWIGDVIYVLVKGSNNRRAQLSKYAHQSPPLKLYFANTNNSFQIGFVKNF